MSDDPWYHGTRANLGGGDLIEVGHRSSSCSRHVVRFVDLAR